MQPRSMENMTPAAGCYAMSTPDIADRYLISAMGEATALPGGDLPIVLFPDTAYKELHVRLFRGSALIVYSDGLVDAVNSAGEEFGEKTTHSTLQSRCQVERQQDISASLYPLRCRVVIGCGAV